MKVTKTYHAVHDQDGNIRSVFATTSSVGAREMMTPAQGCLISQVNIEERELPGEDAKELQGLMKRYRVDTSRMGSLVKKSTSQE